MLPIGKLLNLQFEQFRVGKDISTDIGYKSEIKSSLIKNFDPRNKVQYIASFALSELEPDKPKNMGLYISRVYKIPGHKIFEFVSEIQHDGTISNPGAVFIRKCDEYIRRNHL